MLMPWLRTTCALVVVGCATSEAPAGTIGDGGTAGDATTGKDASSTDANAGASDAGADANTRPNVTGKLVFATSTTHNGNLGGLVGADSICQTRANNAGLGGTFKAYLSDTVTPAKSRIANVGPWSRVDGTVVFPTATVTSVPSSDLDVDENGEAGKKGLVWTGSSLGGVSASDNCDDWQNTGNSGVSGYAASTDQWADDGSGGSPCNLGGRLYCFEQ